MKLLVVLRYKETTYAFERDFLDEEEGREATWDLADYMFREGNYACDCNRSVFIADFCDETFPEMPCGHEIELVTLLELVSFDS